METLATAIWAIAALAFLGFEFFGAPGLGMLYAGLSSFLTALLIGTGAMPADNFPKQLAFFFIFSGVWAVILWRPMQRMLKKNKGKYNDIVGGKASVYGEPLSHGKSGTVKWSGTYMNAYLDPRDPTSSLPEGTDVVILKTEGNTLTVASLGAPFLRETS